MRFFPITFRAAWFSLFLAFLTGTGHAGIAPFSDRGKIDFDTAMGLLNPYGTWAKVDGSWAYTPLDHGIPYTNGRWLYTEYGWTWQGNEPTSWLTEHYGYWKRGADHVWAWYPGPYWLPQTVEIRAAPTAVGWRSAEVDREGNFVESPSDRYTRTDEWTFVSLPSFAGPITPRIVASPSEVESRLEESTESVHSYLTYRQMDRPGPHPADFISYGDGRMFAPMTAQERLKAQRPAPKPVPKSDVPQPALAGTDSDDADDDTRQIVYWVTMSLPTIWTHPPVDARRNEIYLYRPEFYQDEDGIERRIALWLDPSIRATEALHLQEVFNHPHVTDGANPGGAAAPAPAVPAAPAQSADSGHSAFVSPFEDSFHPASDRKTPSASTKVKSPVNLGGAPLSAAGAPIGTNAAPVPAAAAP